ncbi:unnamed protein product [Symbiodinium pilosum]|uniref:Uncharacterized protein n=1 Tax=Symbiodinium pilosum TaxID=2952 RepID=A0A812VY75_SYMPI|nr:unnamed protein product [Symbiodinium pilosum]
MNNLSCKEERHNIFAEFIAAELLDSSKGYVLEVAGGKGALAIALQARGVEDVVVIDPRPIAESQWTDASATHTPDTEADIHSETAVRRVRAYFDDSSRDLVSDSLAVVAMHPDEATDAVVDQALQAQRPFAVAQRIHRYSGLIRFLREKARAAMGFSLPVELVFIAEYIAVE